MPITYGKLPSVFASLLFFSFSIPTLAVSTSAPNWQGPYIGAYFGSAFGSNDLSTNVGSVTNTSFFAASADINAVNYSGTFGNNPKTLIGGIQAGHDWVCNQLVYGIVMDYGALTLNSSKGVQTTYPDNPDEYAIYTSMSTQQLFTLRGRVGYQNTFYWPSLLYITGGAAITKFHVNNNFSDNSAFAGMGGSSVSQYQVGWTAGAGIELALPCHMSVALEYLYVGMPSVKTTSSISNTQGGFGIPIQSLTSPFTTTAKFHASLLKIGLNYRFDERSLNR